MNLGIFIRSAAAVLLAAATVQQAAAADKSQRNDSTRFTHSVGVNVRPKYILPTHKFFRGENEAGRRLAASGSAHLQYSFSFPESSHFGKLYPTAYQGIGVAFNTFFNRKEIGNPTAVYVFQGARLAQISNSLTLDYEWNFGASFGWHPYDPYGDFHQYLNEYNLVVGSRVNAYINFGVLLSWRPTNDWTFSAGVDLTHFSNGNTALPNAGVNTLGGRFGATRSFGPTEQWRRTDVGKASEYDSLRDKRLSERMVYDIMFYGAGRTKGLMWNNNPYIADGTFGIIGLNISPLYSVSKFLRAGASIDIQYDESANIEKHIAGLDDNGEIRFYHPPFDEQLGIGLSLRAEFVMPIFSVNIGFGRNVIYKGEDLKGFYQTLALKTELYKGLYLNIGYKLHDLHDPNNLMLGLGWRFGNR